MNLRVKRLFVKPVALLLSLTFIADISAALKPNDGATELNAIASGHAVSGIVIAYNKLSQQQFCDLRNILVSNLSNQEKEQQISNNPTLVDFKNETLPLIDIIYNNNYSQVMADDNLKKLLCNTISNDFGWGDMGGRPDDPCLAYKNGQADCLLALSLCIDLAIAGCLFATIGYAACFWGTSSLCAMGAGYCADQNDKAHPDCVTSGGIVWKPYMTSQTPGAGCN